MIFHSQYDGKVIIHSCSSSHQPALLGIYIKDYSHRNFPALSQRLHKRRVASSMPSAKVYRPVVSGDVPWLPWSDESSRRRDKYCTRPGKRLHNKLENHHVCYGKTHYKWAIFNSYVKLPEGIYCNLEWVCRSCCFFRNPSFENDTRWVGSEHEAHQMWIFMTIFPSKMANWDMVSSVSTLDKSMNGASLGTAMIRMKATTANWRNKLSL